MCSRITHRGPDGYGTFLDAHAALGHRRLSIIDLAGGAQPIGNEDGSLQVVFNGEIYNYLELREQLVGKGHKFTTQSDTEVLLHLYEEIGERMPEWLNGMFAFAIWDARRQELFLARDRFGKKPLYYSESVRGFSFAFASELKALMAMPGFRCQVHEPSIADFLCTGYVGEPDSIIGGVKKLLPGHSLLVRRGGLRTRRYWQIHPGHDPSLDFDQSVGELRELASEAVRCRLIADVRLGGFLSGGVDSSGVVAMMAVNSPEQVKTFSEGFTNKVFDELEFARLVSARYRTEHYEHVVTPAVEEMLDPLVDHFDEPFGDSSTIAMLYLCRMARQYVTVALSGDGADEVFAGYDRYARGLLLHQAGTALPGALRRSVFRLGARLYPELDRFPRPFRAKTMLDALWRDPCDAYFSLVSSFRDDSLEAILAPELRERLGGYSPREQFRDHFRGLERLPLLDQFQLVDLKTYLPGDILVKVDRASMAYSLEARAPWLDYRLAEFSFRLPPSFRLNRGVGKWIFKEMLRPHLPEQILTRRKKGFAVPLSGWFRSNLRPVFEGTVLQPEMAQYLNLAEVRRLYNQHQSGWYNHGRKLWKLLMLACWHQRYVRGYSPEVITEMRAASVR